MYIHVPLVTAMGVDRIFKVVGEGVELDDNCAQGEQKILPLFPETLSFILSITGFQPILALVSASMNVFFGILDIWHTII